MPHANFTRYWTLFPLWQGHFPVIGEGRPTACHARRYLRTQWKGYREWRTLSLQESTSELPPSSGFHIRRPWPSSSPLFSWHQLWPRRGFSQKATWLSLSRSDDWDPDSVWKNRTRVWSNSKARVGPVIRFVCSLKRLPGRRSRQPFQFHNNIKTEGKSVFCNCPTCTQLSTDGFQVIPCSVIKTLASLECSVIRRETTQVLRSRAKVNALITCNVKLAVQIAQWRSQDAGFGAGIISVTDTGLTCGWF